MGHILLGTVDRPPHLGAIEPAPNWSSSQGSATQLSLAFFRSTSALIFLYMIISYAITIHHMYNIHIYAYIHIPIYFNKWLCSQKLTGRHKVGWPEILSIKHPKHGEKIWQHGNMWHIVTLYYIHINSLRTDTEKQCV